MKLLGIIHTILYFHGIAQWEIFFDCSEYPVEGENFVFGVFNTLLILIYLDPFQYRIGK